MDSMVSIIDRMFDLFFSPMRFDDGGGDISGDRKKGLEKRLRNLQNHYDKITRQNKFYLVIGIVIIIVATISYFLLKIEAFAFLFSILYGFIFLFLPFIRKTYGIEIEIRDIENELDLLSISESSIEQRAEKQFKLHQLELKKYYDQNLRQSAWIFYIGLICIVLGFAIIGIALYFIFSSSPAKEISDKIILASLGAIGGILSDFVGMIYIKMYSETIKSLTDFHNRLVVTHFLHFGNFLVGKIKDEALREKTLADIASNLAKQEFMFEKPHAPAP